MAIFSILSLNEWRQSGTNFTSDCSNIRLEGCAQPAAAQLSAGRLILSSQHMAFPKLLLIWVADGQCRLLLGCCTVATIAGQRDLVAGPSVSYMSMKTRMAKPAQGRSQRGLQSPTKPTVACHYSFCNYIYKQVTALLLPKAVTHQWYNCACCWWLADVADLLPGTGWLSMAEPLAMLQAGVRCEGDGKTSRAAYKNNCT